MKKTIVEVSAENPATGEARFGEPFHVPAGTVRCKIEPLPADWKYEVGVSEGAPSAP
jgi:hypothetical protein